jgi:hypothetical protein
MRENQKTGRWDLRTASSRYDCKSCKESQYIMTCHGMIARVARSRNISWYMPWPMTWMLYTCFRTFHSSCDFCNYRVWWCGDNTFFFSFFLNPWEYLVGISLVQLKRMSLLQLILWGELVCKECALIADLLIKGEVPFAVSLCAEVAHLERVICHLPNKLGRPCSIFASL